jgi:RNase H-fold protein (predicted Holliday junction resolvase)
MVILGFDPGKDKCGVAIIDSDRALQYHQVIPTTEVMTKIPDLCRQYGISQIVLGDQTTAQQWRDRLTRIANNIPIVLVDERFSTLEARDRYWQMYPPKFWEKLVPQGLRQPPRPIDDIVAIILIERYLG